MLLEPEALIGISAILAAPVVAVAWIDCKRRAALRERDRLRVALADGEMRLALRPDASRAELILARLPDPVGECDADGRAVAANDDFARLIRADGRPVVIETAPPRTEPDGSRILDEKLETPDGPRWFSWRERERVGPDGTRTLVRSGREITDRVAAERALEEARAKAEEASAAKSRFLATVSHEFRTPLAGILGMSDLMLHTSLDGEQLSYVQALRSSAEALGSLIEEILDFSRIEAGRIELADEAFEIEPLIQGVVELLAPRAQDKGIEVSCFVARSVPARLRGDRDRLRQILFNVVGNAVKFTARGGVGVTVEPGLASGEIVFTVSDTGPGIPADRLPHIFDEFDQGGLRTTREAGTGLGLAITRRLVERMGGGVSVDSNVGQGSVFRITVSLAAATEEARAPYPVAAGTRALVVASSPFEANYLARRLGEAGLRASRASGRDDGMSALAQAPCETVIVDGSMGPAAARDLAEAARRAGATRTIVLLSPFERRQFGPHRTAGFDSYLTKPVRTRSLFERLVEASSTAPVLVAPVPRPELPRVGKLRVLLAEDNDVNALLAVKSLQKLGAIVDWARDGTEALARAEAALGGEAPAYDLILMDMRMPGLDGFEVTRRIREIETAAGIDDKVRIIALTASLQGNEARLRETAGFDGFLAKPFTPGALARELADMEGPVAAAG